MKENEQADVEEIKAAIINGKWHQSGHKKTAGYVGQFFDRKRTGGKIVAKVEGNWGTYTVSLVVKDARVVAACSCYVGGGCHHCRALAQTFLNDPQSFVVVTRKTRGRIRTLDDLEAYLKSTTLDELTQQLKQQGVTQTAFADSIGMSSRHLTAIKSSEARNRYFHELGATKLACLWVLENIKTAENASNKAGKKRSKKSKR